jgi:Fe-S-cluster containining protein
MKRWGRRATSLAVLATRSAQTPTARLERRLLDGLARDVAAAAARAGDWLVCRPGCSECCRGPFPITTLDARRLRAGLARLARRDGARAAAIVERARQAVDRLRDGFPGDPARGSLDEETRAADRFFERHAGLPCPALDPETGRCELYEARPVTCRTYGLPARYGSEVVPPCRLCFQGADEATIERCRVEPDRQGLEQALLARLGAADERETLIAFALVEPFGRRGAALRPRPSASASGPDVIRPARSGRGSYR